MRVLVTGASGFVGSYAAAEMVRAGHQVRAFVRSPDKLASALEPHGSPEVEVVAGDVRDSSAVRAAVDGCDAVMHAANMYSYDIRDADELRSVNITGTSCVLDAAVAAACDPIIHVSSMVTLLPGGDRPIPADPPLGTPSRRRPYTGSKIAAEALARAHQARGAPVVITHPGAVFGPHDPGAGEMVSLVANVLRGRPPGIPARLAIVDARWLARVHTALLAGGTHRHVIAAGTDLTWQEFIEGCHRLVGRRSRFLLPTPKAVALGAGRLADLASRAIDRRLPVGHERAWVVLSWQEADMTRALELAGPMPPLDETLRDSIAWMTQAQYLSLGEAGALA